MSDLAQGNLGPELSYKVELVGAKLKISAMYDSSGVDVGASVSIEAGYFVDKLAELIPGKIDDMILAALKGALLGG